MRLWIGRGHHRLQSNGNGHHKTNGNGNGHSESSNGNGNGHHRGPFSIKIRLRRKLPMSARIWEFFDPYFTQKIVTHSE
jgi:hypothetical protein